jgi:hypothetical protein
LKKGSPPGEAKNFCLLRAQATAGPKPTVNKVFLLLFVHKKKRLLPSQHERGAPLLGRRNF